MNAFKQYKPLLAALVAMGVAVPSVSLFADDSATDAGRAVIATGQPALPGTGPNNGDALRAQMQASPGAPTTLLTGSGIHDSFGTPLNAREVPAAPGTGPNSGDLVRADLQSDPASYAALGTRFPLQPGAGSVAGVDSNNVALHGHAGWNPALVELQATPKPFPWETRVAKAASPDKAAKADVKP
jgi:hypothetical protein